MQSSQNQQGNILKVNFKFQSQLKSRVDDVRYKRHCKFGMLHLHF